VKAIQGRAKVILTTAYSEFALESYELDVVDYLLKPVRFTRFLQAVQKVVDANKDSGATSTSHAGGQGEADDYIFVKTESKGKLLKINLGEIDFIEGMKNYVAIHCGEKKTLVYTSMKELEERLPQKLFYGFTNLTLFPLPGSPALRAISFASKT
jgi:DNA-binding LytR/AlgR family response regulator